MGEQYIFAWRWGYVGKLEIGRPFEVSCKGWLEGCQVDGLGREEGYFILRENSNELKQGHTEMHGLFQGQTVSSF